ncbi:succinate dehydrogenase subunit 4, mitochondrial-like isoform X1 [Zingiber officinale]|uniref:succinate dehydrogenase subunit 4, mitochondrial-like isoform X1 n=1 Tax=Zingiber officinale TaxID=94328 RepID=UPI001C4C3B3B|nr:succinate dehydrogenase subunit 4, mitochondrial-like isoform X1 [Zingiber officinale]
MASFLLRRSKSLPLHRFLLRPAALSESFASEQCRRGLICVASRPLSGPGSADLRPDRAAQASPGLAPPKVIGCLGSGKISVYGKILPNCTFSSLWYDPSLLARSLHTKADVGEMNTQGNNLNSQEKNDIDSKVLAFSPLEGTLAHGRNSELVHERLKLKSMELSIKTTYALIPLLLLVSKSKLTTSLLILCTYWQIYGFYKEIFLDYVHHEVTRKWVLIYFKLLLLILAKDTILAFDLV